MPFRLFWFSFTIVFACAAEALKDPALPRVHDDNDLRVTSHNEKLPIHGTNQKDALVIEPAGTILHGRRVGGWARYAKEPRSIHRHRRHHHHHKRRKQLWGDLTKQNKKEPVVESPPRPLVRREGGKTQALHEEVKANPKAETKKKKRKTKNHVVNGCKWDTERKTLDATLYGHGKCEVQLCNCLESRASSLVWDLLAKCSGRPEPIDMVLTFRRRTPEDEGVQGEGFLPDTNDESFFAKTMKTFGDKTALDPKKAPIWERLGFKLGTLRVPVDMLFYSAAMHPGQCKNDKVIGGKLWARGFKNSNLLTTAGEVLGSVEFRTFGPLNSLGNLSAKQQLVVPVLKTMVEDFRDYRSVDVTHCDRGGNHITFGRAPSLGGTPVAQIIDTDRVKKGFDAWRMAHWFGAVVYNTCQFDSTKPKLMFDGDGWKSGCGDVEHKTAMKWLIEQLSIALHGSDHEGTCRGMRQLVNSVVKPAFQVAMGIKQAPDDWWAGEIDKWAARFHPLDGEAQGLDLDMVFKEARLKDAIRR